jgi:hypothetical protein
VGRTGRVVFCGRPTSGGAKMGRKGWVEVVDIDAVDGKRSTNSERNKTNKSRSKQKVANICQCPTLPCFYFSVLDRHPLAHSSPQTYNHYTLFTRYSNYSSPYIPTNDARSHGGRGEIEETLGLLFLPSLTYFCGSSLRRLGPNSIFFRL